jgi:hypothetical protein
MQQPNELQERPMLHEEEAHWRGWAKSPARIEAPGTVSYEGTELLGRINRLKV